MGQPSWIVSGIDRDQPSLFGKFELIEPGVVPIGWWHPDPAAVQGAPPFRFGYCGVGRKS